LPLVMITREGLRGRAGLSMRRKCSQVTASHIDGFLIGLRHVPLRIGERLAILGDSHLPLACLLAIERGGVSQASRASAQHSETEMLVCVRVLRNELPRGMAVSRSGLRGLIVLTLQRHRAGSDFRDDQDEVSLEFGVDSLPGSGQAGTTADSLIFERELIGSPVVSGTISRRPPHACSSGRSSSAAPPSRWASSPLRQQTACVRLAPVASASVLPSSAGHSRPFSPCWRPAWSGFSRSPALQTHPCMARLSFAHSISSHSCWMVPPTRDRSGCCSRESPWPDCSPGFCHEGSPGSAW
jgi:hypothetical protein